jgi:hypothetical protein
MLIIGSSWLGLQEGISIYFLIHNIRPLRLDNQYIANDYANYLVE